MMRALRERTPELAVLKMVGFTERRVLALILTEALTLYLSAAPIGLGLSTLLLPRIRQVMDDMCMSWIGLAKGVASADALALMNPWIPARRGSRLRIVDELTG